MPTPKLNLQFKPFPLLTTGQLCLREITRNDTDAVYSLRSNAEVMQFLDRPLAKTPGDALSLIDKIIDAAMKNEGITWGIAMKDHADLIGTIGFWKIDTEHYRAEIGYMLSPAFQGRGLMSEALTCVINYGFDTMGIHSIEANVNPANAASIRLLEKTGFVREAYFKENYYYDGRFIDSAIYSLLDNR